MTQQTLDRLLEILGKYKCEIMHYHWKGEEEPVIKIVNDYIDDRYKDSEPTLALALPRDCTTAKFFKVLSLAVTDPENNIPNTGHLPFEIIKSLQCGEDDYCQRLVF